MTEPLVTEFLVTKSLTTGGKQWEAINRKQITRWQHVSHHWLLVKNTIIVKNATAYTWDWYCHLVVDRASFVSYEGNEVL